MKRIIIVLFMTGVIMLFFSACGNSDDSEIKLSVSPTSSQTTISPSASEDAFDSEDKYLAYINARYPFEEGDIVNYFVNVSNVPNETYYLIKMDCIIDSEYSDNVTMFSADGKKALLEYQDDFQTGNSNYTYKIYDITTKNVTEIKQPENQDDYFSPYYFSPDLDKYLAQIDDDIFFYTVSDGSSQKLPGLKIVYFTYTNIVFSPDGKYLIYSRPDYFQWNDPLSGVSLYDVDEYRNQDEEGLYYKDMSSNVTTKLPYSIYYEQVPIQWVKVNSNINLSDYRMVTEDTKLDDYTDINYSS